MKGEKNTRYKWELHPHIYVTFVLVSQKECPLFWYQKQSRNSHIIESVIRIITAYFRSLLHVSVV